jgi:hypothetical protein
LYFYLNYSNKELPETTIKDLEELIEFLYKKNLILENLEDIYLAKYRFNLEDISLVPNLYSCTLRIIKSNSGIRYYLNTIEVTAYITALKIDF